jgi:hypothetical protein
VLNFGSRLPNGKGSGLPVGGHESRRTISARFRSVNWKMDKWMLGQRVARHW